MVTSVQPDLHTSGKGPVAVTSGMCCITMRMASSSSLRSSLSIAGGESSFTFGRLKQDQPLPRRDGCIKCRPTTMSPPVIMIAQA